MKSYNVTIELSVEVEAASKYNAVSIAKRIAAESPDLLRCSWIADGYHKPVDLSEAGLDKKLLPEPFPDPFIDEEAPF